MHFSKVFVCSLILLVPTWARAGSTINAAAPSSAKQTRQDGRPAPYFSRGQNIGASGSSGGASSAPSGSPQSIGRLPTFSPDFNRDHGAATPRSGPSPRQMPAFSQGFSGASVESAPPALGSVPPPISGRPNFAAPATNQTQTSSSPSGYSGQGSYSGPGEYTGAGSYSGKDSYTAPSGSSGYTGQSSFTGPSGYSTTTYAAPAAPTLPYSTSGSSPTYPAPLNISPSYSAQSYQSAPPTPQQQSSYEVVPSNPISAPAAGPTYAPGGHAIIPATPQPTASYTGPAAVQTSKPTYTFSPTNDGTIQVFQNGQLISTTTPQNAAMTYGYQQPRTTVSPAVPLNVSSPIAPVVAPAGPIASTPSQSVEISSNGPAVSPANQQTLQFPPTSSTATSVAFPPLGTSGIANTTPQATLLTGPSPFSNAIAFGSKLYNSAPVQGAQLLFGTSKCIDYSVATVLDDLDTLPAAMYYCNSAHSAASGLGNALGKP
jgi:hypothetical protein